MLAVDGKVIIDDNALFRQPALTAEQRDTSDEPESERLAREAGITYIKLEGQIGCMVNGAGLAMTTMDMTKLYGDDCWHWAGQLPRYRRRRHTRASGRRPANHSIRRQREICVLFNIFGGITRCDEVANGISDRLQRG